MAKNIIQTRKYPTIEENKIKSVSLFLATSDDVKEWSNGEVTKPETINYKSFKPEKQGLFDEVIFGPTIDFKCPICGNKYKKSNEGQICEKTDECRIMQPEILPKIARRTRMGHIELASPIVHFWFFKIDHSIISKLLGLKVDESKKTYSKSELESLIYFKSHIVVESGGLKSLPKNEIIDINKSGLIYHKALEEILQNQEPDSLAAEEIQLAIDDLEKSVFSKIGQDYGIDFYELNSIIEAYSDAKIMTGAKAIEYLLENIDLRNELRKVKRQINKINHDLKTNNKNLTKIQKRSKLYKRLDVINSFIASKQEPKSMLIYNLPIIPADLRPLVQIDGGRHSTTDVNELYRRIIIRNNRLKKWFELDAPILIVQNELRMLQEAVDALIDNTRKKPMPVMSKDNRPLKSIADSLTGKKGRFRQNLLGKRVDYSGRSVIVIGPELKMHQAGIPRQMAAKLFEPWIIKELIKDEVVSSIKAAKKMVEEENRQIWPFVEKAIKGKVVLLNRAPTLHRLSIQAFEPVLVRGKAIRLHALVTTAFNADFDGDQMAVHVPISEKAIREARELMLANKNILGPKDGEPIINPSQDMVLGIYYLTIEKGNGKGQGSIFNSYEEMIKSYENGYLDLHSRVVISANKIGKEYLKGNDNYIVSTVGKFIFNQAFPSNFPFIFNNSTDTLKRSYSDFIFEKGTNFEEKMKTLPIQKPLTKKDIAKIARLVFDLYSPEIFKKQLSSIIDKVHSGNYQDTVMQFSKLNNYRDEPLNKIHCQILSKILKKEFEILNKRITLENEGIERIFETFEKIELLEKVWFNYTNIIANSMDKIKSLGFKYSTLSGVTVSISDMQVEKAKESKVQIGEKYINDLKKMFNEGLITDDERYQLTIKKWSLIKGEIQDELEKELKDDKKQDNPIFMMMNSGARGNVSNFVQLSGMRGLMANNKKINKAMAQNEIIVRSTVEVPVKSSFLDGLSIFEFYSSTHGARKGLTDTALNTANSGYLTRRLVDMAQNIVVREEDCGSDNGFIVKNIIDTKTGVSIVSLEERIEGRFTNSQVVDNENNVILEENQLIEQNHIEKISKAKITRVEIRSVLGCLTQNGVCKKCYGKDLATNKIVQIGEAVGIIAAQSIGEPGTQLTMRTFHTGGVAGVEDITGGFDRLKQLIDATKQLWDRPAIISKTKGKVIAIKNEKNAKGIQTNRKIIQVQANDKSEKIYEYPFFATRLIRVTKNQEVDLGQKLVEGPIVLNELLEIAGTSPVQNYLLKEIQRLYRMQGISISDKYIEIIIRQMLSKILINDSGDSDFYVGSLVDFHDYRRENGKLLHRGKKPAYGQIVIKGAKQIPLLSSSFLAAASYQETAKVLVHAAISGQKDNLQGLKENIILGHKIPAGTSGEFETEGKYDIANPRSYFQNKKLFVEE